MTILLTILCENTVAKPFVLLGKQGVTYYLDTPDCNYLCDTGPG